MTKLVASADCAIEAVNNGDNVWVHSMAATPVLLVDALSRHAESVTDVTVLQLHLEGAESLASPKLFGRLRNRVFFAAASNRELINNGQADYVPMFLSELPKLFRSGRQELDVALIQVSPPDNHGNCSLGISVEATKAACDSAKLIIAHINPQMPRTHGDGFMRFQDIDIAFEQSHPMICTHPPKKSKAAEEIGRYASELIEDGDCLQMGIGVLPDAVLSNLSHHQHLGIHTEMFSDSVIPLVECGAIDNSKKVIHRGKLVTGFVTGSQKVYDFVDDNGSVRFLDIEYVNNIATIKKNKSMVSLNSALQLDLTGQVCADSLGTKIYSGVGGQLDFVLGSQLSEGGRSIIALPSTARGGSVSRIVSQLTPGSGVVTTRAHVDYIVTEFGVASLRGASLRERKERLIEIAHPDFREALNSVGV
ncbi:MAG: 4-hydroxybutyrate--acetyl-CoA CoA transferase [Pseudomonadales bacterium]|nr:4-hydroxybutyrate--acetyl-CoA CoA transferase [Pseudomonadales bacterium]